MSLRAVLVALALVIWTGFVGGALVLAGYLAVTTVRTMGRSPADRRPAAPRSPQIMTAERLLIAGATVGAVIAALLWVQFTSGNGDGFIVAGGPPLVFAILAALTAATLHRRQG